MKNTKQDAFRLLENPRYSRVKQDVTIDDHGVTVVQFFHYDEFLGVSPEASEEEKNELLKEVGEQACSELFQGTGFKHVDTTWASDGARVYIYRMDFWIPTFRFDFGTVLGRLARGTGEKQCPKTTSSRKPHLFLVTSASRNST